MKKFYALAFMAFIGIIILQSQSCKGPQPSKCTITVYDSAGIHPQPNIKVHLDAQVTYNGSTSTADLKADGTTDGSGQCSFTFKNPCIMNVTATVSTCTTNPTAHKYCEGTGIVRLEEGKTNTKSIFINQ